MSTDYDSDASLSDVEDEALGQTNVLLGFAEEEEMDDPMSHLGGKPTWMDDGPPPSGSFAKCESCGNFMNLLLQLNGDLPERFPNDARWLYIFGCVRSACNRKPGSIKAFRAVKKYKLSARAKQNKNNNNNNNDAARSSSSEEQSAPAPSEPEKPAIDLGASIFGGPTPAQVAAANPFASPSSASASASSSARPANPFAPLPPPSSLAAKPPQKPEPTSGASDQNKNKNKNVDGADKLTATFAEKARISSPPPPENSPVVQKPVVAGPAIPWPADSSFPTPYKHFYLDAEYEVLSAPSAPDYSGKITTEAMDYEDATANANAKGSSSAADSKETFESSLDKDFLRFSSRLEHNPEQVLRYEFNGTPILHSTTDAVGKLFSNTTTGNSTSASASAAAGGKITTVSAAAGSNKSRIPRCEYCGRERVFEVQLVPHAIAMLEEDRDLGFPGTKTESGMEWETIIVGVCANNCGPETVGTVEYRQEWVGVQWEEGIALKK
ncbi:hypothetical protein KEM56_002981 [Ascosphaera pollenicola]|nr:hypothetical protein KEM56_002981 [Ascosphaera pollenicola]